MSKNADLDTLIGEALDNIRDDRKLAREFLNEIANQIAVDADNNRGLSPVAAKHIETMQRSNEQLVKIIGLKSKNQEQSFELSESDKNEIYDACKTIVEHEDAFIDLAFQMGPLEGLTADQVKQYIRFIGNRRLEQLGLNPIYDVKKNPLTWLDTMLNGVEHMNFFEGRATEYSKASTRGTWGEVFA